MGSRGRISGSGQAAQATAKAPKMPRDLKPELQTTWRIILREIQANGVKLKPIDVFELVELCEALVERPKVRALLADQGYTIEGRQGGKVRNPLCLVLTELDRKVARLSAKFGLTPADRARLDIEPVEDKAPSLAEALFAKVGQQNGG